MSHVRLIGRLDHNLGWAEGRLVDTDGRDPDAVVPASLLGAVAGVALAPGGRFRLLRDPLGLNKLFWASTDDALLVAARPHRLVAAGCPFDTIRAFPPGTAAEFDLETGTTRSSEITSGDPPSLRSSDAGDALPALAGRIRSRLDAFVAAVAQANAAAPAFVCLSGGLDSSGIAVLAREHFPGVTAVSFDIRRDNGHISEDRRTAERLARHLGLPLLEVNVTADELLDTLDEVLIEAIDWRDFNVHAALVNACMARAIAASGTGTRPLVLTGDLANEFLVDYHAESYGGQNFYRLPRVPRPTLRTMLVRGLETSHREIGPFEAYGLRTGLPYAAAADLYLALPPAFLEVEDRKDQLSRLVFGDRVPDYVYARPKTRAQVGDPHTGSGVLSVCTDRGRDHHWLRRRFAELHDVADLAALDRFIRGGRYRAAIPLLQGAPV